MLPAQCHAPFRSPVYALSVSMLILNYVQICLPCIVVICLVPVFCFCMPCLIRLLARLQEVHSPKGATDAAIAALPLVTIPAPADNTAAAAAASSLGNSAATAVNDPVDTSCPICLSDMEPGQQAR